jgi:hypothetical protein
MTEDNRPIKELIVNVATGEETVIYMTDEDIVEQEQRRAEAEILKQEREAEAQAQAEALATLKASAKAKLVAGTPLTAEEADTLVI